MSAIATNIGIFLIDKYDLFNTTFRHVELIGELDGNILLAENAPQLKYILENYDEITHSMSGRFESNNEAFNRKFADIVDELFQ